MLQKIRERLQGIVAWVILTLICVTFALFGIQNYLGGGREAPIATVGEKDFFQQDLNQAYQQYAQRLAGSDFNEDEVRKQALSKMVRDEVLLQHVEDEGMVTSDRTARDFVATLEYFQTDGQFDKTKYNALLASQGMTSAEFIRRIKKALIMEQFQKAVADTSFSTAYDIDHFYAIQNQQRNIQYLEVPAEKVQEQPGDSELKDYYQQHQEAFLTEELASIAYVELDLDKLAAKVSVTDEQLRVYFQEQQDLYTTPERRKISHILVAFKPGEDESQTLARAQQAKTELDQKDFASVAAEISDDQLTAKNGGDLGLFNVGEMEKSFEEAAMKLQLGEISDPVKTKFGYHLIKVTDLVPAQVKPFDEVKDELKRAYQKSQVESDFYAKTEQLSELSFENPGSLLPVAEALGLSIEISGFFSREKGEGIAAEQAIRQAAFSLDVLKGNNSEPVELSPERIVVLRVQEHKPAAVKEFDKVKSKIIKLIQVQKSKQQTLQKAEKIKSAMLSQDIEQVASDNQLKVKSEENLTRTSNTLDRSIVREVFKLAKPVPEKPTIVIIEGLNNSQFVVKLLQVKEGTVGENDKQQKQLVAKNMASAFGRATLNAVFSTLESEADISIREIQ